MIERSKLIFLTTYYVSVYYLLLWFNNYDEREREKESERESKKGTCTEPFVAGETRNVTVMNTHQAGIEFLGESILRGLLGLEKNV